MNHPNFLLPKTATFHTINLNSEMTKYIQVNKGVFILVQGFKFRNEIGNIFLIEHDTNFYIQFINTIFNLFQNFTLYEKTSS